MFNPNDERERRLTSYGNIVLSTPTDVLTVQDVRDFLDVLESMGVPNTNILQDGFLTYEYQTTEVGQIECANHKANETAKYDWIVKAHESECW